MPGACLRCTGVRPAFPRNQTHLVLPPGQRRFHRGQQNPGGCLPRARPPAGHCTNTARTDHLPCTPPPALPFFALVACGPTRTPRSAPGQYPPFPLPIAPRCALLALGQAPRCIAHAPSSPLSIPPPFRNSLHTLSVSTAQPTPRYVCPAIRLPASCSCPSRLARSLPFCRVSRVAAPPNPSPARQSPQFCSAQTFLNPTFVLLGAASSASSPLSPSSSFN